jgi:predicted transcriptional regulator
MAWQSEYTKQLTSVVDFDYLTLLKHMTSAFNDTSTVNSDLRGLQ